ncbi:MAG TPA: YceI family protein [Steroidobacteraceae bacterium]|nr:YceI family protein [Steroidobacteraceae bacterium]
MRPNFRLSAGLATALVVAVVVAAAAPGARAAEEAALPASTAPVPAGAYTLDKSHASLIFKIDHLGFSHFTARFTKYDAQLQFDPANLSRSSVKVNVDPRSIESDNAPAGFMDQLRGDMFLNTAKFPEMTFRSTRVTGTGAKALRIDGDLTLHGVTRPVILNGQYNGGYAGHPMDPHARIGFSAQGTFKRADFGGAFGIPAPGTTMGVADQLTVIIEAEFIGPPLPGAAAATK